MIFHEEYDGFGMKTAQELGELQKALEAGYALSPEYMVGGGALRVEAMDATLHVATFTDRHIQFWKDIPKDKATNTVEQFIRLTGYGNEASFIPEGVAPEEGDANLERGYALVKYVGTLRKVTHPMTLVNTYITNAIALQNMAGAMWILRNIEWALFFGNSKLGHLDGNGKPTEHTEFDGLFYLCPVSYDLKGQPMTEAALNDVAQVVLDNYGFPTDFYLPFQVYADINKQFLPKERVVLPTNAGGYQGGVLLSQMVTQAGVVNLKPCFFLGNAQGVIRMPLKTPPLAATSTKAPTPPASISASTMTGSGGEFYKSFPSGGTTYYKATACNRFGESAPTQAVSVTITSADLTKRVPLTITNNSSISVVPEYFNIYRSDDGGKNYYWIASVPAASQAAGGTTVWNDTNSIMPGTYVAFMGQLTPDTLQFKQLSPLIKMDLAVIEPSIRWMLLLYGTLVLYTPLKWCVVKNIGLAS